MSSSAPTPSSSSSLSPRGGNRGGRGGGRRPRSSGRGGQSNSHNNNNEPNRNNTGKHPSPSLSSESSNNKNNNRIHLLQASDEDIMIAFMPYLRQGNEVAMRIHKKYQQTSTDHDQQRAFIQSARHFLQNPTIMTEREQKIAPVSPRPIPSMLSPVTPFSTPNTTIYAQGDHIFKNQTALDPNSRETAAAPRPPPPGLQLMELKNRLDRVALANNYDNDHNNTDQDYYSPARTTATPTMQMQGVKSTNSQQQQPLGMPPLMPTSTLPMAPPSMLPIVPSFSSSSTPLGLLLSQSLALPLPAAPPGLLPTLPSSSMPINKAAGTATPTGKWTPCPPGIGPIKPTKLAVYPKRAQGKSKAKPPSSSKDSTALGEPAADVFKTLATTVVKKEWVPKRTLTRLEEQVGRLLANGVSASSGSPVVVLRPRKELTAKWLLPLSYLRQRTLEQQEKEGNNTNNKNNRNSNLEKALQHLSVGLYRRGCTENTEVMSIISKEIIAPKGDSRKNYPFTLDERSNTVWGTVPFYSPRTPGHVVLRLCWQNDPVCTLATGPDLFINCCHSAYTGASAGATMDLEPTLRFILSNFKSKNKNNATSLSSLHSLASVLEQFDPPSSPEPNNINNNRARNSNHHRGGNHNAYNKNENRWDGAGRAAWGCICEAKKVIEACAAEYAKQKEKLAKIEDEVTDLQKQVEKEEEQQKEEKEKESSCNDNPVLNDQKGEEVAKEPSGLVLSFYEKKNFYMKHTASNERRWKDSQMALASILKAILGSPSSHLLLKRDLLIKLRLEYELYCTFCESFAPSPFDKSQQSLTIDHNHFPLPINQDIFQTCAQSRADMQFNILKFEPNTKTLKEIVMPGKSRQPKMDRNAVDTFNRLSSSMCQLYQGVYMTSDRIHKERELVRARTESIVSQCGAFPPGTRVVVFGSAANGFGSPSSDLDMCLQLPLNTQLGSEVDKNGALAMAKLAECFENMGMMKVDTARLSARIPVLMFNSPRPNDEDSVLECDLSMQNPLACLNTSLLLTYSRINPMTSVLAAIVKRWAKNRNINNPSRHTLSSYGYILMLLHFLTYHRPTNTGLIESLEKQGSNQRRDKRPPLLPNLQWMDAKWPQSQPGLPYEEFLSRPNNLISHPSEKNFGVNAYFYRLTDQTTLENLQRRFPGQDLSVAILLASFFRYYAYEFDYKKHVVSLHSTENHGVVEREVKAEVDSWKVHFQGLAIEDPFETFYDVAHVVKGGNFHQLRNEFALAYTKIADAASGQKSSWNNQELQNISGKDLIDWICEPVVKDKD